MPDTSYRPTQFWERSHSAIAAEDVNRGYGVRYVGGGESDREAAALYRLRRLNAKRILGKATIAPKPRIFELGSGGGYWVEFCRRFQSSSFVGSDLAQTAVDRLSATYPGAKFFGLTSQDAWSNIERLGPYDLSLAIDVLYHITDDTVWLDSLNRLCTNTKEGSLLLISDYFFEQPIEQPEKCHVKHRKMQSYLDVLAQYNFKVEAIQPMFYFLNRIVSGPWRDHTKLVSPILRFLSSSNIGLAMLGALDAVITAVLRPMNQRCKMRFLLARRCHDT